LAWAFSFYPLRRLKLFTSVRVGWIIYVYSKFSSFRSFIRRWENKPHGPRNSKIGSLLETFRLLDVRTFSFPRRPKFLLFFPLPLGDHFSIFRDTHGRQTSPLSPPLLHSRVQLSAIGDILHLHDFLPNWQLQTFVDALALHLPASILRR
jgi:hypothetical protein